MIPPSKLSSNDTPHAPRLRWYRSIANFGFLSGVFLTHFSHRSFQSPDHFWLTLLTGFVSFLSPPSVSILYSPMSSGCELDPAMNSVEVAIALHGDWNCLKSDWARDNGFRTTTSETKPMSSNGNCEKSPKQFAPADSNDA
jgi:hypothetical protein